MVPQATAAPSAGMCHCINFYYIPTNPYLFFLLMAVNCYLVTAVIHDSVKCSGYRRLIYEDAQRFRACYHPSSRDETIWYPPESKDLHISVIFESKMDARDFLGQLSTYAVSRRFKFGIDIADDVEPFVCSEDLHSILVSHYVADASSSPLNSAVFSGSLVSFNGDPLKEMRSLEALNKVLYPKECIYGCHIAQESRHKIYAKDVDNVLFGSAIFHSYFDGDSKRPPPHSSIDWGTPPEIAIKFVDASDTPIMYDGNPFYSINVHIIFRDVHIAMAMEPRWREGTSRTEDELVYSSFFYACNRERVKKYLDVKLKETLYRWRHCDGEEVDFTELDVISESEII